MFESRTVFCGCWHMSAQYAASTGTCASARVPHVRSRCSSASAAPKPSSSSAPTAAPSPSSLSSRASTRLAHRGGTPPTALLRTLGRPQHTRAPPSSPRTRRDPRVCMYPGALSSTPPSAATKRRSSASRASAMSALIHSDCFVKCLFFSHLPFPKVSEGTCCEVFSFPFSLSFT